MASTYSGDQLNKPLLLPLYENCWNIRNSLLVNKSVNSLDLTVAFFPLPIRSCFKVSLLQCEVTDSTSSLLFPSSLQWLEQSETGGSHRTHHDPPVYRPIHCFSLGIAAVG